MRTGKESSGRSSGRKSATPYKSAVPYKNMEESRTALAKSARPVHTVKLPKANGGCAVCGDHPTITELIDYEQIECDGK